MYLYLFLFAIYPFLINIVLGLLGGKLWRQGLAFLHSLVSTAVKKILTTITILALTHSAHAITTTQLRHIPGFKALEANIGLLPNAINYSFAYTQYCHRSAYWKAALHAQFKQKKNTAYTLLTLQPALAWTCLQFQSMLYINLIAAAGALLQILQAPKQNLRFNFNLAAGIELECFLTNQIIALLSFLPQLYLLKSPYSRIDWQWAIGFKFTF